jgi:hypothetical protein
MALRLARELPKEHHAWSQALNAQGDLDGSQFLKPVTQQMKGSR